MAAKTGFINWKWVATVLVALMAWEVIGPFVRPFLAKTFHHGGE